MMGLRASTRGLIALAILLFTGCAQIPKDAGFDHVKGIVDARTAYEVHWIRGVPEDEAVGKAVERLLEEELSVDAAVQIALLNNPSLQALYEELGITQADVVQAGLLKNPGFIGSARFPNEAPSKTNLEFEVVQDFLDLLVLPARKRLSEAQFEKTKLQVAEGVIGLAAEVKKAYYAAVGAERIEEIRRLYAHAAQASHEMARRLHQAGNMSELKMARERVQYEGARIALARSEADRLAIREKLSDLMGLWGRRTAWRIPKRLPEIPETDPPLQHLESLAVSNRLDLAAAKKEVEILAQAVGIAVDWRWFGSAEIGVSAERDTDGQRVMGPTLSLELPIFDQGQAKISRLEARFRQSHHRMTSLAVRIRSEIRSLRDQLLMARYMIQHYKDVVLPLREEIVGLTQREYNYMLVGVFDLLSAKREEFEAYEAYIHAIQDYWNTHAALEHAVGGGLPSGPESEVEHREDHRVQPLAGGGQLGTEKVSEGTRSERDHEN